MIRKTDAQIRLEQVRAAISKILTGAQSVRYGDRQLTRADLGTLRDLEKEYALEVSAEQARLKGRSRNRITYLGI
ncbi:hypothetical protein [Pseudomonas sp. Marseille-QA0892]